MMRLSWKEYEVLLGGILQDIEKTDYDVVIGIKRGGLVPAVHLSNLLGVPMEVVELQKRDGDGVFRSGDLSKYNKPLIVDDICDTGETLEELHLHLPKADVAVLINKTISDKVTYSGTDHSNNMWIVFPWEV